MLVFFSLFHVPVLVEPITNLVSDVLGKQDYFSIYVSYVLISYRNMKTHVAVP